MTINKEDKNNPKTLRELTPNISPLTAAFIGLVGVFVLYQIGGSIITLIIFGFDLSGANVNAMRLLTIASQLLFILLPALLLTRYIYEDITTAIRFHPIKLKEVGIFLLGMVILIPLLQNYLYVQNYLIDWLAKKSEFVHSIKLALDKLDSIVEVAYNQLLNAGNIFEGILVITAVAIVPAISEESLFRGFIQTSFELKSTPFKAAIITGVFFGLYHFNPYGLVALIALGIYFSYAVYKTNSLLTSVTLHFTNNIVSVLLFFILDDPDILKSNVVNSQNILSNSIQFILLLIVFGLFILFTNNYFNNQKKSKKNDLPEL